APTDTLDVEYPEGLHAGPVFDVAFDGREPFTDWAGHRPVAFPASGRQPQVDPIDPAKPKATGGAATFDPAAPSPVTYPSPHAGPVYAATVEAWIVPTGAGARTVVHQPGVYTL